MWIGSPLRGMLRIVIYAAVTLPLMPVQLLANVLGLRPVSRWLPVYYHRAVCWILGIKVEALGLHRTAHRCDPRQPRNHAEAPRHR